MFAANTTVTWASRRRSWAEHIKGDGYSDEQQLIQPIVFPAFAQYMLGFEPGGDLAAEETGHEGTPDFTPADAVTHPFVFETKSTNKGADITGFDAQITRYLDLGRPRIRRVLLTNLVGARVFDLDENGRLRELYRVDLRALLSGPEDVVATTGEAQRLARLVDEFSHRALTREQKLQQVRDAPEWNPLSEVTSSQWVLHRLDRVVQTLTGDVETRVAQGALTDQYITSADERLALLEEMRLIATRLGIESADSIPLSTFVDAGPNTEAGKVLRQYCSHVAYYAATRLVLVRIWEDLDLLEPMLHDGGFNRQMTRFDNIIQDVIDFSFSRARQRYRSLFDQRNGYTWYTPAPDPYVDVIYELANTYLGKIRSDVLGQVYEQMLERVDRKLRGQYYTPRDIISLIWDLIRLDEVAEKAEAEEREPYILDIATGSGGFLVEAARRLRERLAASQAAGAEISSQAWLDRVGLGLNGVEIQRFSAYLAELNLLVQLAQVVATDPALRIPPLGILSADTLALHEPDHLFGEHEEPTLPNDLLIDSEDRRQRAKRVKAAASSDFLMDVACGNPPYVGEKLAAPLTRRTRERYPYWESFVGQHLDYLYWFLILGVSKLREGGRFGFITTEYWLRAEGAAPLRGYLAQRCYIDRIILFRDMRLFTDAPGQDSMIVIGTRIASHDLAYVGNPIGNQKPRVSIYEGSQVAADKRPAILSAMRDGRSAAGVRTFTATVSPNSVGRNSWSDTILTADQITRRRRLSEAPQVQLVVSKGVETTVNTVTSSSETLLSHADLMNVGGPGTRAGIQLLTTDEVSRLGTLTQAEKSVIRRVVNTRDVYPYAVVVPDRTTSIVYLTKPDGIDQDLSDDQVIGGTPFPPGLPNVGAHLTRFRAILETKTRDRHERRPWWTLHRPRPEVVGDASADATGWAPYCLTTRWGSGGRLVVGLAPPGTSPASGLHVLRPSDATLPAAYISAVFNSSIYQDIAETLPPGQLRQRDLENLGLPDLGAFSAQVTASALRLANIVTDLVRTHGPRWPMLADTLRDDVALKEIPDEAWTPAAGPAASWGQISSVSWIGGVELHRAPATRLGDVSISHDLFGLTITVSVRGQVERAVVVHLAEEEVDAAAALAARFLGLGAVGGCVRDLDTIRVPINAETWTSLFREHHDSLTTIVGTYHEERAIIDAALNEALSKPSE